MIEGLKPYPSYTDTGLPWLGQIPATWKLRRAKYLFREVDERSRTGSEELLSVSHKTGVTPRSQKNVTMFMAESNIGHKVCRPDDLVINTLWAWMAALGVSRHHGIVSPAYGVYRPIDPSGFRPRFADQLLRTPFYAAEYQRCSTGVNSSRLRLYPEAFFRIPIMLPPKEEQEAIVRFLAHANQKIDGFIRAKRKLIGLLNEQKQAIIHQAVTRGIDPSVPLNPSGIPWLGDIPKHWEVRRLKGVLRGRLTNGLFKRGDDFGSGTLLVNVADVYAQEGIILPDKLERVRCSPEEKATFRVLPGDMFFVRSSLKLEGTGRCALVQDLAEDAVFECHIVRGRPDGRVVDANFLLMFLRSWVGTSNVVARAKTVTMSTVGQTEISSLPVAVPPLHEQRELLKIVATESAPATAAIARTEREIALMQEYRARLTTDIITGKLDVREAASKLPELADQPTVEEAIDDNEADLQDEP